MITRNARKRSEPTRNLTSPRIRVARAEDAAAIAELLTELGYPHQAEQLTARIASLSETEADHVLVAVLGGKVTGVAHLHVMPFFTEEDPYARVTALVVSEKERQQGVGRDLLLATEAIARDRGCAKIEITSNIRRTDAHAFYLRMGYSEHPRRFLKAL